MKVIRFNGRNVTVASPRGRRKPREAPLLPCAGRRLIECQHGVGCPGHVPRWILLRAR